MWIASPWHFVLKARANVSKKKKDAFAHPVQFRKNLILNIFTTAPSALKNKLLKRNKMTKERTWRCSVCGYIHKGENPPKECPQCSSLSKEFFEFDENRPKTRLKFDGKKFDVLIINGSSHHSHNTSIFVDIAENYLKKRKVSYQRINLNELNIYHCWCCYSMKNNACTYPCRNQLDDMQALYEMMLNSKAIIVASPINWNNMPARLKDFLDRLTSLQNMALIKKEPLTKCKVAGIMINGHEDGAMKTAMDIFIYFQQMGYVLAPYGIAYRTHGKDYDTIKDNEFFKNDKMIKKEVEGLVNNIIETMKLDMENKLAKNIVSVCE